MGDFNIAHTRLDLRNWRTSKTPVGFLPEERDWFESILGPRTLVDVVRGLHPDTDGPYSWWSWMGNAFNNDVGWRIDYHLATPALAKAAIAGGTDRADSYEARMSDHAPVVVDYLTERLEVAQDLGAGDVLDAGVGPVRVPVAVDQLGADAFCEVGAGGQPDREAQFLWQQVGQVRRWTPPGAVPRGSRPPTAASAGAALLRSPGPPGRHARRVVR